MNILHKPGPLLALAASLALWSLASLAAPPDFSGVWQLNTKKGENLGMVAAVNETVTIAQTPAEMTLDFASRFMGRTTLRSVRYDLDGKAVPNEGAMGDKAETTARWDGEALVVAWASPGAIAGTTTIRTETRTLSADGKTMTVKSARGEKPPMIMVYEKAEKK